MSDIVFSWAEDATGKMVHIDSVCHGLKCGCICPNCHEPLLARHGDVRAHGFAHHSATRGATLKICYMVTLYKLAEQIIQQKKRIHAPSYYGIFKEKDLEFVEVKVNNKYDREDKQPDVIATTADGKEYLIEFTFAYKVQHNEAIDYKNLTCLEIDLSKQTLESLANFLLNSSEDRKWLNNQEYFGNIESVYRQKGKTIRVVDESECDRCSIKTRCCAVQNICKDEILTIENSGHTYRLCKPEEMAKIQEAMENDRYICQQNRKMSFQTMWHYPIRHYENSHISHHREPSSEESNPHVVLPEERTCFMCKNNLDWKCRGTEFACCGIYSTMNVPKKTPPDKAKTCDGFKPKQK